MATAGIVLGSISIIITIIITIAFVFLIFGWNKDPITINEFNERAEECGYTVINVLDIDEVESLDDGMELMHIANNDDETIMIQFGEFKSVEEAKKVYQENETALRKTALNKEYVSSYRNLSNHSKYSLTSDEYYIVISRIEDTLVYVETDKNHSEEVKDFLKKIGY